MVENISVMKVMNVLVSCGAKLGLIERSLKTSILSVQVLCSVIPVKIIHNTATKAKIMEEEDLQRHLLLLEYS